jgi:pyruvate dehydrogenase E2 component (dihydrolipoamide acetyltransferase)
VAHEVVMPAMEMDQESATLLRWIKPVGSVVVQGEPIMEIETDKVTVEIEAPRSGILDALLAEEGDVVAVGTVVALIRPSVGAVSVPTSPTPLPAQQAEASEPLVEAEPAPFRDLPLGNAQAIVAARLQRSHAEAPHFALRRTIDASALQQGSEAGEPDGSTVLSRILAACALALVDHPRLNAHFVDDGLRLWTDVHLGVAVAIDDALVVPVIRQAQLKSVSELAAEVTDLASRARSSQLTPSEIRGSTFSVSNLGMFAVDDFTAILNPPEVAILTIGRVESRAVVTGEGNVAVAPTLTLTLCADHRAVNGAEAAQFLTDLSNRLERPYSEDGGIAGEGNQ